MATNNRANHAGSTTRQPTLIPPPLLSPYPSPASFLLSLVQRTLSALATVEEHSTHPNSGSVSGLARERVESTKTKGTDRSSGTKNYAAIEVDALFDLVSKTLPLGDQKCVIVANQYAT